MTTLLAVVVPTLTGLPPVPGPAVGWLVGHLVGPAAAVLAPTVPAHPATPAATALAATVAVPSRPGLRSRRRAAHRPTPGGSP